MTLKRNRLSDAIKTLLGICALLLMSGCSTLWQTTGGNIRTDYWSIDVPAEWMLLETNEYHMLSKDGPYLQYFLIQSRPLERKFRHIGREMDAAMLPHEASQTIVDDLRADPALRHLRIIENAPAMIDGRMGFKLNYIYEGPMGVDLQTHLYGVITPPFFFTLRYTAAKRYYFERNIGDFKSVLQSLQLGRPRAKTS